MRIRKILSTALFVLTINSILAQASLNNYSNPTSPYNFGWKYETHFIATSAGLLLTGFIIDKTNKVEPYTTEELNNLNRNDINGFDRGATYNWSTNLSTASDVLQVGSMLVPALFLTNKSTRKDFGWLLLIGLEVFSINYGLKNSVKDITNRPKPYVYNSEAPINVRTGHDSRESYFSGHTSTTASMSFFVATVISDYNPGMNKGLKIGLWSAAVIYPVITAYLQVESDKHFPTDVIAGYAVGAFT